MRTKFCSLFILLAVLASLHQAAAQGTAFTYQGQLSSGGSPANGLYDFEFLLWDDPAAGLQIGSAETNSAVSVSGGLFTTTLNAAANFGASIFTGTNYWLEIRVRTNGNGSLTPLTPRQPLSPAPYAIMANSASNLLGVIPLAQLPNAVLTNNSSTGVMLTGNFIGTFNGLGGNLTSLNANNLASGSVPLARLSGITSNQLDAASWQLATNLNGGNAALASNVVSGIAITNALITNSVYGGNGGGLTNLNASQLASGVIPLAQLPGAVVTTNDAATVNLNGTFTGTLNGNGLGISFLNANSLFIGTVPLARLLDITSNQLDPATWQLATNLNGGNAALASNVVSGITVTNPFITNAVITNSVYGGDGGGLTNLNASQLASGVIPLAQLPGAVVTNNNSTSVLLAGNFSGSFTGDGANVANVNAATLGGLNASGFWQVGGNNVVPGQILGSTNSQPLNLRVGNIRALRLGPVTNDSPYLIGGASVNTVDANITGAVIAGGGTTNFLGAASSNHISASFSSIGGGSGNWIQAGSDHSVIGNGWNNLIASNSYQSVIAGGQNNIISNIYSVVGGGLQNTNSGVAAMVGGGYENYASAQYATIGGGLQNNNSGAGAMVGGGQNNIATASGILATLGGGYGNYANGEYATIGGGEYNTNNGSYATVAGGGLNDAAIYAATVGGGYGNYASAEYATIGGGEYNTNNGSFATVAGGVLNAAVNYAANVGGGFRNTASGFIATVGGGEYNTNSGDYGTVGGGHQNTNMGSYATVGGGDQNIASGSIATIGGGQYNINSSYVGTIAGGQINTASGQYQSTVGGGYDNQATNSYATVPGGNQNIAGGEYSFAAGFLAQATNDGAFVWADSQGTPFGSTTTNQFNVRANGGVRFVTSGAGMTLDGQSVLAGNQSSPSFSGSVTAASFLGVNGNFLAGSGDSAFGYSDNFIAGTGNNVSGSHMAVGGGSGNSANYIDAGFSTIGGGEGNTTEADYATIGGGSGNSVGNYSTGSYATIGGGQDNSANGFNATIAGGYGNKASGPGAFIGGGGYDGLNLGGNTASGEASVIGGGMNNTNSGNYATVGGGQTNSTTGPWETIGGGRGNTASGDWATVGGGLNNQATNNNSTVPGGANNIAGGLSSFAAGLKAQATNDHSFVWSDGSATTTSTSNDQFMLRASGGVIIYSSTDTSTGVSLAGGSGAWANLSDRNAKEDFTPVTPTQVLSAVAALPITQWSYKTEHGVRHVGPMAQDFHAAFGLGEDDKHITTVDEEGVALAAIQGLNQKLKEKDGEIQELKQRLEKLEQLMNGMKGGAQ
jgi:hypothetical protein